MPPVTARSFSFPFITEAPQVALHSSSLALKPERQNHPKHSQTSNLENLRAKLQALTDHDRREFPISPLFMNTALLHGLDHLVTAFGTEYIDILKHGVFFSNLAGQNLGAIAMQMGAIMYDEPGAFEILKDIYQGFTNGETFYPKGIVAGGYHALLRKIENPALQLEHRVEDRVNINSYKNIFPYRPNESGEVIFDYFDPTSNTGHEIKFMQNFCAPDKINYNEDIEFDRIRQAHKYIEWLNQDKKRKLEYHMMVNVHIDFLRILKEQTPRHLQNRVRINIYSNLNFFTPMRTVSLADMTPRDLWDKYYKRDLEVRTKMSVGPLQDKIIAEINSTIQMIQYNTSWNYFGNSEVLGSLKLTQAIFVRCLSGSLAVDFDKLMDAVIRQWQKMQHEDLAPANCIHFNSCLIKLLQSVPITLTRRNATALFHLFDFARNLAFETRPYHENLEEFGVFYALSERHQRVIENSSPD